jgi:hypothetical protein
VNDKIGDVHNVTDVRQLEVHTAEPLVPGPSRLDVENAIAKLKKYKSPGSDLIPTELIQAGEEILLSAIHKLIDSIWNKEELLAEWKESIIVPVLKEGDKTDCNNYHGISPLSTSYKIVIEYSPLKVKCIHILNYWGSSVWVLT